MIAGAGPAGLTAAYEFARQSVPSIVLDKDSSVGGLSKTVEYKGYRFDIGGHRFYTKVALVEQIWRDILGDDLLRCQRLSRIYYGGQFFNYPLSAGEALRKLGLGEALRCGASFLKAQIAPARPERDLESWICNRFGRRLFEIFFKTYTEKVWGMQCRDIGADWAAQRIRGLSLFGLLQDALTPQFAKGKRRRKREIKTLIQEFLYPRLGPGMMWERMASEVVRRGSTVELETPVIKIRWREGMIHSVVTPFHQIRTGHFLSTMPVRHLLQSLEPAPPDWLLPAADAFRYRDFLTVAIILRKRDVFRDNWIYVHDAKVKAGRIQNFKSWSPEMVPDPDMTCLGLEYFCQQGDDLWSMRDEDLIQLGAKELGQLGLADPALAVDGAVVRAPKAYPVYDDRYEAGLALVRRFLQDVPNLQVAGRNGMHRYNNQDHSMLTGILAARNILGANYNLWEVNTDETYLEEGAAISEADLHAMEATQPMVPVRLIPGAGEAEG